MRNKQVIYSEIIAILKAKEPQILRLKKLVTEFKTNGYDINSKKDRGKTLLHYAVMYNNEKALRLFVKAGVNANICDDNYNTPLLLAVINNNLTLVKALIECDADPNMSGEFEQSPLHLAVVGNNLEIVKYLVHHGADLDLVDEKNLKAFDIQHEKEILILYTCYPINRSVVGRKTKRYVVYASKVGYKNE